MHQISTKWCEFVPKVHKEYPNLLAEMFAYCIAAAHLELEHMLIDSLMISNVNSGGKSSNVIYFTERAIELKPETQVLLQFSFCLRPW